MNRKLLSIDVGIKNLGICILNVSEDGKINEIVEWSIISLTNDNIKNCSCILKNGKDCKSIGKYIDGNNYYCERHKYNKCIKINKKKAKDVNIIDLGRNLKEKLDILLDRISIDNVIIENQISTLASRMKTLQGMIIQYFIDKNIEKIEVVSSHNKLKILKEYEDKITLNLDSKTYVGRKKLGIAITNYILETNNNLEKNKELFIGKKDDLADAFLQGLYYIKNKK